MNEIEPELDAPIENDDLDVAVEGSDVNDLASNDNGQVALDKIDEKEKEVTKDGSEEEEDKDSLWYIFTAAFASGLIALLTPCVFPMIPMTVSFFTKQSKTKAAGIKNAIIFGLSIIVIYILLGTLVTWILDQRY